MVEVFPQPADDLQAVGLAGTFAPRIQEIDSPASLEHASPADATARYFAELFESQTQSECRIADGHGSLHWQRPQQIDHSTPECGNPLTFDLTNIEICQGGHMEMDIATDLAAQD
jgi:hypothetical protein